MRLCRTPEERLFFQQAILDRLIAFPPFERNSEHDLSEQLAAECLERLKYEKNEHLLNIREFPSLLEELQCRVAELQSIKRSPFSRAIYHIRQRYKFAKLIYPKSPMRRLTYQIRGLLDTLVRASWATAARLSGFGSIDR